MTRIRKYLIIECVKCTGRTLVADVAYVIVHHLKSICRTLATKICKKHLIFEKYFIYRGYSQLKLARILKPYKTSIEVTFPETDRTL